MPSLPALFEGDCLIPTRSHPQGGPLQTPVTHLQSEGQAGGSCLCGSWHPMEPTGPRAHAGRELVSTTGSYKLQGQDKVGQSAALREKVQPVCSGEVTRGDPGPLLGGVNEHSIWCHPQPLADADAAFQRAERERRESVYSKASKGSVFPIRKNPFKEGKIEDEEPKIA